MNFNVLARKVAKGTAPSAYGGSMNVEDMIRFALMQGAAGADEIDRLCAQHGWLANGLLEDGTRVAPFARWAQVCAAYGRGGVAALQAQLSDRELATFAIAVLAHVKTVESVRALTEFCESADWRSPDVTHADWQALSALNQLLSFKGGVLIDALLQDRLRRMGLKAYDRASKPFLASLCLCAIRGAATPESLAWLQALETADVHNDAARVNALKAIKRQLA
ncbi:hypothetical protein M2282_004539 [Variovorax boronicumulans]|uniref:hypothetical protein n=1 Tax=Variovorax boronicumulans TaxID=436515 RepID=UPI0024741E30|nr:hypothetical protein [Variovorax boronicumulans]MDH6169375.1 hypothetical protein [Variovorax boronicumulans]